MIVLAMITYTLPFLTGNPDAAERSGGIGIWAFWLQVGGMIGMTMAFAAAGVARSTWSGSWASATWRRQQKLQVHFLMLLATGAGLHRRASRSSSGTSSSSTPRAPTRRPPPPPPAPPPRPATDRPARRPRRPLPGRRGRLAASVAQRSPGSGTTGRSPLPPAASAGPMRSSTSRSTSFGSIGFVR